MDEIVIHPRDNAMVLATHGRASWILDHIEPIQEYAAARNTEARLFSPPPSAMFRRPARDRNYEFWGNQVFFGENPPQSALLSYFVKNKPAEVKLKVTDAAGREVREITIPAAAIKAGISSACWDLRVQPVPAPNVGNFPGARAARRPGGRRPGRQSAGRRSVRIRLRRRRRRGAAGSAAAGAATRDPTSSRAPTTSR